MTKKSKYSIPEHRALWVIITLSIIWLISIYLDWRGAVGFFTGLFTLDILGASFKSLIDTTVILIGLAITPAVIVAIWTRHKKAFEYAFWLSVFGVFSELFYIRSRTVEIFQVLLWTILVLFLYHHKGSVTAKSR